MTPKYSYKPYHGHWVVVRSWPFGEAEIICHCDSSQECEEEIAEIQTGIFLWGMENAKLAKK